MDDAAVIAIMTGAITDLGAIFTAVATPAIAVAVGIFGLYFGWNIVRRFVS